MMNLVYQEPDSKHCVLACLATLMNMPMEAVKDDALHLGINYDEGITCWDELRLLQFWGWQNNVVIVSPLTNHLIFGRTYLATVPSLNHVGGMHRIIVKCLPVAGDPGVLFLIHDPNRVGKRYGVDVLVPTWSELMEFVGVFIFPEEVL